MKLCIRQRLFSWGDTYDVYDEEGNSRYVVKPQWFSFGHQLHVYEKISGREVGSIHQQLFTFTPGFDVVMNGQRVGVVKKRITLFTPVYDVDYQGWTCTGDLFGWDYQVFRGQHLVMSISKALITWGDTYMLDFADPSYELPGLLLVLAIDAANCDNK